MDLIGETQSLLNIIEKIQDNTNKEKDSLFKGIEIRKQSYNDNKSSKEQMIKSLQKPKTAKFKVIYLSTVIEFLELETILNLSLINKQFFYFIKSIYFFKFMNNARESKKRLRNIKPKIELPKAEQSSFFGKITNYFGLLTQTQQIKEKLEIDPKILESKINLYEKVLLEKLKNIELSKTFKNMRSDIDSIIASRKNIKTHSFKNLTTDEEMENIKASKIEKEYNELYTQILSLRSEYTNLSNTINSLNNDEIEMTKKLSSLKLYIKNNMKIEDIYITSPENLRSKNVI